MDMKKRLRETVMVALVFGLALASGLKAEEDAVSAYDGPREKLHVYLLIGQSNMAGRAPIAEDDAGVIDRCFLLNADDQWEPAQNPLNRYSTIRKGLGMQKLNPGYTFAKAMLAANPDISIGLVVNAKGGSSIEQWGPKSNFYREARRRAKQAAKTGVLKGVLWHQGESDVKAPEGYQDKLVDLIASLRGFLQMSELPFIVGQINNAPVINDQLAKLPERVHASGCVSSEGLKATDRWHFDAPSVKLLGERYAQEMLTVQRSLSARPALAPGSKPTFVDTHVHAYSCKPDGLDVVADWMTRRNVKRCIIHPLSHALSIPANETERQQMLANYRKYKGKIDRFCIIEPDDVSSVEEAVERLEREKQDGAIGFGEHYGKGLKFDDPKNLRLYEACERVGLPVMFHMDQNKNMDEKGLPRLERVLKMFPECILIAHAYWWLHLPDGTCDRLLQTYPNLYADVSGPSRVPAMLNRDRNYTRAFLIRNADKILFGSDAGWWSFGKKVEDQEQQFTLFEELDLPDDVRQKIYRTNAERLFGFTNDDL
jgi:predicted TIM-barrel fold metal-dependent hydrolase